MKNLGFNKYFMSKECYFLCSNKQFYIEIVIFSGGNLHRVHDCSIIKKMEKFTCLLNFKIFRFLNFLSMGVLEN